MVMLVLSLLAALGRLDVDAVVANDEVEKVGEDKGDGDDCSVDVSDTRLRGDASRNAGRSSGRTLKVGEGGLLLLDSESSG